MIHYIIQIVAFQLLFLVVYDFFLRKETFFSINRAYLLVTPVLSLLLPFVKLQVIAQNIPQQVVNQLTTTANDTAIQLDAVEIGTTQSGWTTSEILMGIYLLGLIVSLGILIYKAYRLFKLRRTANKSSIQGIKVLQLPDTDVAFSFFGAIFLGDQISYTQKETIFQHEKIHIEQRHSLDLLFFEILRIVLWFNPLVYIFQNRITLLQEFIADHQVALKQSKAQYCESLLSQVFQTQDISFINTFFNHSLIKKRIMMLQKSKSKQIAKIKYLFLLPLLLSMLVYTACSEVSAKDSNSKYSNSEVIKNIETLKNSIAKNGELSEEEEKALKVLYAVTTTGVTIDDTYADVANDLNIPFGVIEKAPVYPGCENLSNEKAKACFSEKLSQFVSKEFDASIAKKYDLKGGQEVYVEFKIDKTGKVTDIFANTDNAILQAEAERVASKLPRMIPGELNGMEVSVLYNLPIVFNIK